MTDPLTGKSDDTLPVGKNPLGNEQSTQQSEQSQSGKMVSGRSVHVKTSREQESEAAKQLQAQGLTISDTQNIESERVTKTPEVDTSLVDTVSKNTLRSTNTSKKKRHRDHSSKHKTSRNAESGIKSLEQLTSFVDDSSQKHFSKLKNIFHPKETIYELY